VIGHAGGVDAATGGVERRSGCRRSRCAGSAQIGWHDLPGCAPVAHIPIGDPDASVGAIDDAFHTLYAADGTGGTIAIINTATCNAGDTSGCSTRPPTIPLGMNHGAPVLNPTTQTLYTVVGNTGNQVAVLNAATCNAQTAGGCGQAPALVTVHSRVSSP